MKVNKSHFHHIERVLSKMLTFEQPSDVVLTVYFREHSQLGSTDRNVIAETCFTVLRNLEKLRSLFTEEKPSARKLAIAALAKIFNLNLKLFSEGLTQTEQTLAGELKGKPFADTLTAKAELPQWVIDKLSHLSEEEIIQLGKGLCTTAPLDIRVNTIKAKRDDVLAQLAKAEIPVTLMPFSPIGIRVEGKPQINKTLAFKEGKIEIQDEGSQILGLLVGAKRTEMVVDFCAGAGGKTLLIGAQMASTGRLYAFDVSEKRLGNLKPRLARSGLSNVNSTLISHENDTKVKRLAGKVDRVLVDAPCSGLGTLRRNPDLKYRQSADSVAELNVKQASILQAASKLLKKGGRLVYATCSILPQENQDICNAFLEANPNFSLVPMQGLLDELHIDLTMNDYLAMQPNIHHTDGFFAAVFVRQS